MNERRDRVHNLTRRTSRRDISHIAHRRRGILLNFGISSLSTPRSANPATNPSIHYSERVEERRLNFASSREEASRERIDVDRLNSVGRSMSYLFCTSNYARARMRNIFRRKGRLHVSMCVTLISTVFLILIYTTVH